MKKSCILEILTSIKSTSKCLRIDAKIRTKNQKMFLVPKQYKSSIKLRLYRKILNSLKKYQEMFPSVCDSTFNKISNRHFWKRA